MASTEARTASSLYKEESKMQQPRPGARSTTRMLISSFSKESRLNFPSKRHKDPLRSP